MNNGVIYQRRGSTAKARNGVAIEAVYSLSRLLSLNFGIYQKQLNNDLINYLVCLNVITEVTALNLNRARIDSNKLT